MITRQEDDILDAFAMEHSINRETLIRYLTEHRDHVVAICDLYMEIELMRSEQELEQQRLKFLDQFATAMVKHGWCCADDAERMAAEELEEFERFEGIPFGDPRGSWTAADADSWAFNLKDDAIREKHQ